jgi:hypothetical protein
VTGRTTPGPPADLGLPDVSGSFAGRALQVLEVFRSPQFMDVSLSDWITHTRDLEKARARLIHSHRHNFRLTPRGLGDGFRTHFKCWATSSGGLGLRASPGSIADLQRIGSDRLREERRRCSLISSGHESPQCRSQIHCAPNDLDACTHWHGGGTFRTVRR